MNKVFVAIIAGKPHVFSNKALLLSECASLGIRPDVHECEVQKRVYKKKTAASVAVKEDDLPF